MIFKHKKLIYLILVILGVAGVVTGLLIEDNFFLFTGFVLFSVSWPFDTIFMKCEKCGVSLRHAFNHAVLRKYRGINYITHLMKLEKCQNPNCKQEL